MKKAKWVVALLVVALAAGLAVTLFACGGGTEGTEATESTAPESTATTIDEGLDYELVLSVGMPAVASLFVTYLDPWAKAVEASSNGRVKIEIYDNNSLVKEEQQIEACRSGTSDMTAFQPTWEAGVFPVCELASQPMIFPSTEVADRVMWDLIGEFGQEELKDFHLLGIMMISPAQYGGKVEVRVPDDMEGMRIRSGGAEETEAIKALGATPVEIATSDIPIQIERNAFDGAFMSWGFHVWMTNEWATNWAETNSFYRPIYLVMSKEKWDSLPAAVQEAFDANSGIEASVAYNLQDEAYQLDNTAVPAAQQKGWDRLHVALRAEEVGSEIIQLTPEERELWLQALAPVLQTWATRYASKVPTDEILVRLDELVAQYYSAPEAAETTETSAP